MVPDSLIWEIQMSEIIIGTDDKGEKVFRMIEQDLLNTVQNNTAKPIDEIKSILRNLLNYYVSNKTLLHYKLNDNITNIGEKKFITFQILVSDPKKNTWTYTLRSAY